MDSVAAQAQQLLDSLGDSADEVADTLRSKAILGVRNTARFLNPIIRYVGQAVQDGRFDMDLTDPNVLRIKLQDGSTNEVALSQAILDFLQSFDHGAYPDLEAT